MSTQHDTPYYLLNLTRTVKRGKLDAEFLAEAIGVYNLHGTSYHTSIGSSTHAPTLLPRRAADGALIENLGFGVAATLTYERPCLLARRFSTLDHLTRGRVARNIVQSILNSGAKAPFPPQRERIDGGSVPDEDPAGEEGRWAIYARPMCNVPPCGSATDTRPSAGRDR